MTVVPKHKLNKLGGIYTAEIRNTLRKPSRKSISKRNKNETNKPKIYRKNPNKSNKFLQKLGYQRWFIYHQPRNLGAMMRFKIPKNLKKE